VKRQVLLVALLLSSLPAVAGALDRGTAEADAQVAMADGRYLFCSAPRSPLSRRALRMCPLASELPGCEGFAKACSLAAAPKKSASSWELPKLLAEILRDLGRVGLWLVALVALVFAVLRFVRRSKSESAPRRVDRAFEATDRADPDRAPPPNDAERLLRAAATHTERGELNLALFAYLGAALRALGDRGAIRLARHHTHGEYVRGCREAAARPLLAEIVRDADIVRFGGQGATKETVERAALRATSIVRAPEARAPALVSIAMPLALFFSAWCLVGCSGPLAGSGADPAGDDLLLDLLAREGATVSHMSGSLATLPMRGGEGPAVIVSTERTPLDEETQKHLVAWVAQGGVLVLAGDADEWPKDLWARRDIATSRDVRIETPCPADDDACAPPREDHVRLAAPAAMTWPHEGALRASAVLDSGQLYGAVRPYEKGLVLGLASDDLLTNAGLHVHGNAAGLVALLESLEKTDFRVTRGENGLAPPANPFSGLLRVGLGLGLVHALAFVALLFLSVGARHRAPTPLAPPARRAFAEHVRAIGALYARTHATGHALRAYAEYVDRELRASGPRGVAPGVLLAQRAGADPKDTSDLYARAVAAGDAPAADDLRVLGRLCALFSRCGTPTAVPLRPHDEA
jgi:hypothetical protein